MKLTIFAALLSVASAFVAPNVDQRTSTTQLQAEGRREFLSAAGLVAGMAAMAPAANADRDYENLPFLGGSEQVDLNNANVRVYLKMPGMYPGAAGKIVSNGPYKSVGDIYNIKGLTSGEKDVMKKYESRFVVKEPAAEFVIDRINNGLYR